MVARFMHHASCMRRSHANGPRIEHLFRASKALQTEAAAGYLSCQAEEYTSLDRARFVNVSSLDEALLGSKPLIRDRLRQDTRSHVWW